MLSPGSNAKNFSRTVDISLFVPIEDFGVGKSDPEILVPLACPTTRLVEHSSVGGRGVLDRPSVFTNGRTSPDPISEVEPSVFIAISSER